MIDLSKDIHSLTDFKRNTTEFVKQLKDSGHPLVLTVNGKAELVQGGGDRAKVLQSRSRSVIMRQPAKGVPGHDDPAPRPQAAPD